MNCIGALDTFSSQWTWDFHAHLAWKIVSKRYKKTSLITFEYFYTRAAMRRANENESEMKTLTVECPKY